MKKWIMSLLLTFLYAHTTDHLKTLKTEIRVLHASRTHGATGMAPRPESVLNIAMSNGDSSGFHLAQLMGLPAGVANIAKQIDGKKEAQKKRRERVEKMQAMTAAAKVTIPQQSAAEFAAAEKAAQAAAAELLREEKNSKDAAAAKGKPNSKKK